MEEQNEGVSEKALGLDSATGAVRYGNTIIGEFDGKTLTLNAGWCRLAGVGLVVQGDTTDRRRVLFQRGLNDHRLAAEA